MTTTTSLSAAYEAAKTALEGGHVPEAARLLSRCVRLAPTAEAAAKLRELLRRTRKLALPAGCVLRRKARSTGTVVGLYRSAETFETDPSTPWATVCEDHGGIVCHQTRAIATANISCPEDWCPYCSGDEPVEEE